MTNLDWIRSMTEEEMARFFCSVDADVWGFCKAPPARDDIQINKIWLQGDRNE